MPLSDTAVRNFKPRAKPFKLSDGGGLHLLVPTHGSKLWRLACRFGGKQKTLALGIYPGGNVGGSARETGRGKETAWLRERPSVLKRAQKNSQGATFKAVANELLAKHAREGRAPRTLDKQPRQAELSRLPSTRSMTNTIRWGRIERLPDFSSVTAKCWNRPSASWRTRKGLAVWTRFASYRSPMFECQSCGARHQPPPVRAMRVRSPRPGRRREVPGALRRLTHTRRLFRIIRRSIRRQRRERDAWNRHPNRPA